MSNVIYMMDLDRCFDLRLNNGIDLSEGIKISNAEHSEFWLTTPPEGKMRKPNTYPFEFCDTPCPTVEQLQEQAKSTRDNAIDSFVGKVIFDGSSFQASKRSKLDMDGAIRKGALQGYLDTDPRPWRLTDNTWRDTTLGEIKQIVDMVELEILQNWESIWSQFNIWDAGAKDTPFIINE